MSDVDVNDLIERVVAYQYWWNAFHDLQRYLSPTYPLVQRPGELTDLWEVERLNRITLLDVCAVSYTVAEDHVDKMASWEWFDNHVIDGSLAVDWARTTVAHAANRDQHWYLLRDRSSIRWVSGFGAMITRPNKEREDNDEA